MYLSALPILTSATGLTSWMFAVEGSAANLYLLSLAYAFKQENSNGNARKVFLCSLWYLPLLLGAYIFHSKVWNESLHTDDMVSQQHFCFFFYSILFYSILTNIFLSVLLNYVIPSNLLFSRSITSSILSYLLLVFECFFNFLISPHLSYFLLFSLLFIFFYLLFFSPLFSLPLTLTLFLLLSLFLSLSLSFSLSLSLSASIYATNLYSTPN